MNLTLLNKLFYLLMVVIVTITIQSCATSKYTTGRPIRGTDISKIVKGQTTSADIVTLFGAPTSTSTLAGNELYIYKYCVSGGSGFSVGYYSSTSSEEKCDELTITFDKQSGKVVAFNFDKRIE